MIRSSFASRLDTSLLASVEFSINENEELDVLDVEQEMELNRKKEKDRKKMKKQKNKKDAIDPRLYPTYHDKPENNGDDNEMKDHDSDDDDDDQEVNLEELLDGLVVDDGPDPEDAPPEEGEEFAFVEEGEKAAQDGINYVGREESRFVKDKDGAIPQTSFGKEYVA